MSRTKSLAPIGHAVPADDLPKFASGPQSAGQGFRANLIQREIDCLRSANRAMREALRAVIDDVEGPRRPYSTDSYLPHHIVVQARRALTLGGLL